MNNVIAKELVYFFYVTYLTLFPLFIYALSIPYKGGLAYYFGGIIIIVFAVILSKKIGIFNQRNHLVILFGFATLLGFSVLDYHNSVVINGTPQDPYLLDSDPELYHQLGMVMAGKGTLSSINFTADKKIAIGKRTMNNIGYPVMLSYLYKIFPDLSMGLLLNVLSSLIVIVLVGGIAQSLYQDDGYISVALLLAVISPQILSPGVILLKDSLITFGVTVVTYFFLADRKTISSFLFLLVGVLIVFTFRTAFLLILFVLPFVKNEFRFKHLFFTFLFFFSLYLLLMSSQFVSGFSFSPEYILRRVVDSGTRAEWDVPNQSGMVLTLVGNYNFLPIWQKIIFLPIPSLVQYLLPFDFWNLNIDYPWRILERNLNLIWILFIGPLIIFGYTFLFKYGNKTFKRLTMIGLAFYLLVAFLNSGAIPRYYYPFMPILLQISAFSIIMAVRYIKVRNRMKYYFSIFYLCSFGAGTLYLLKQLT